MYGYSSTEVRTYMPSLCMRCKCVLVLNSLPRPPGMVALNTECERSSRAAGSNQLAFFTATQGTDGEARSQKPGFVIASAVRY